MTDLIKYIECFDGFGTQEVCWIEATMEDGKYHAWQHFDNGDSEYLGAFDTLTEALDAEVY